MLMDLINIMIRENFLDLEASTDAVLSLALICQVVFQQRTQLETHVINICNMPIHLNNKLYQQIFIFIQP